MKKAYILNLFQHSDYLSFDVCSYLLMIFISILSVYVYCYFGKMSTDCFEQLVDCIYTANWLGQNSNSRKILILIMTNAQQPLYYHGFHIIIINMATFTQVIY